MDIGFTCRNSHYLWYEFLPAAAVKCTDAGSVSSGDSVSAMVRKWSASNSYTTTVANLTTGKTCSVTQKYGLSAPYYGAFIVENPMTGTGTITTLPSFSTITLSKAMMAWLPSAGGDYVQDNLYYIDNTLSPQNRAGVLRYRLFQGSEENISVSKIGSGGNFTENYLMSFK